MKKIASILSLSLVLLLAGCFDLTEEIFLNKDGSGKYVSLMDLSSMKEMIDMFKTMSNDSTGEENMNGMNDLDSIQHMWKELESINGITNVRREKKKDFVYQISFDFANMKALNEAITKRKNENDSSSDNNISIGNFYAFNPGSFSCLDTSMAGLNEMMKGGQLGGDSDSAQMAINMMKGFMGDMKYTCVYHLPGKVVSYTNKNAKLSEDGKTLTLAVDLLDDSDPKKTLVNEIKYKK